jgi:hypothetical protein
MGHAMNKRAQILLAFVPVMSCGDRRLWRSDTLHSFCLLLSLSRLRYGVAGAASMAYLLLRQRLVRRPAKFPVDVRGVPDHSLPCSFRFTRWLCLVYVPFTERQTFHHRYLCVHQSGGGNPVGMVVAARDASRNGMGGNGNRPLSQWPRSLHPAHLQAKRWRNSKDRFKKSAAWINLPKTRLQSGVLLPLQGTIAD